MAWLGVVTVEVVRSGGCGNLKINFKFTDGLGEQLEEKRRVKNDLSFLSVLFVCLPIITR